MPRPRTGTTFQTSGRWFARITLSGPADRPAIALPTCHANPAADARASILNTIAEKLRQAGCLGVARDFLDRAASASPRRPRRHSPQRRPPLRWQCPRPRPHHS